jgi:hypothetical protein
VKRLLIVLALAFAISSPTLAGDIPISGAPLPNPTLEKETTAEPGDISTSGTMDKISEAALSALLAAFSLLS